MIQEVQKSTKKYDSYKVSPLPGLTVYT